MKIIRTWKGWTLPENASAYQLFLTEEVFPAVKQKGVKGLEHVSISTRSLADEVEFFLTLRFDSIASVKQFAGEEYEQAYIPDKAKTLLSRYDTKAEHFELKEAFDL